LYNNLLKSGNVVKNEEARVIDSNSRIAERLQYLAEILQETSEDDFAEEFTAGLDAMQVEQLLGDPDNMDYDQAAYNAPQFDTQAFEQMREDAQAEAEGILAAAREEAESILARANADAGDIRESAMASGREEGYKAGYDEGILIAQEAEAKCAQREQELEAYYGRKIDELEPLFIDKITAIYEQIFNVDLTNKKELAAYLLSDAIRNIEGGRNFFIHVPKENYEYVLSCREELLRGLPGTATIEIIEDLTLAENQSFIEAESGIFDCGLGTELELLKKELMLLSYKA